MSRQSKLMWTALVQAGIAEGQAPEAGNLESPWFVKLLLAISGWLAACFLLGFIGIGLEFIYENTIASAIVGASLIGASYAIGCKAKNEFLEYLALSVSLTGQVLIAWAVIELKLNNEMKSVLVALLHVPLAVFMPSSVHRIFSAFIAALAFSAAMFFMETPFLFSNLIMLLVAWIWLNEFNYPRHMKTMQSIGYGLLLALILLKCTSLFGFQGLGLQSGYLRPIYWTRPWMGEVLSGAVTLYVVWQLLKRRGQALFGSLSMTALLGTLLVCAASLVAPGITTGMVILLLGFASSNFVLLGLGVVSLLFYISSYYYLLSSTLLHKSLTLLAIGLVLLAVRWLMLRFMPSDKEAAHA